MHLLLSRSENFGKFVTCMNDIRYDTKEAVIDFMDCNITLAPKYSRERIDLERGELSKRSEKKQ